MRQVGQALGHALAGVPGGIAGRMGGGLISRLTGNGDYKLQSNSLIKGGQLMFKSAGSNAHVRIRHSEMVTNIDSSLGFTLTAYDINPGNSLLFPWLSTLSRAYEKYRFKGLVFSVVPTASTYAASQALGQVALSVDYDVLDHEFKSIQTMAGHYGSATGSVASGLVMGVECARDKGSPEILYIRQAQELTPDADKRWHDWGRLGIGVDGCPTAAETVGQLWATYDVEFYLPRPDELGSAGFASYTNSSDIDASNPFGNSAWEAHPNNTFSLTRDATFGTRIHFPKVSGAYLFEYTLRADSGGATAGSVTAAGMYDISAFYTLATSSASSLVGAVANDTSRRHAYYVPDGAAASVYLDLAGSTVGSGPHHMQVNVYQLPLSFVPETVSFARTTKSPSQHCTVSLLLDATDPDRKTNKVEMSLHDMIQAVDQLDVSSIPQSVHAEMRDLQKELVKLGNGVLAATSRGVDKETIRKTYANRALTLHKLYPIALDMIANMSGSCGEVDPDDLLNGIIPL